jgi:carbon storage regulator CsrA
MLVLTRKSDESLTFELPDGRKMLIRIKDIHSQSARVCIDAPKDVRVYRTEAMNSEGQS